MSKFDPAAKERELTEYEKELLIILMEECAEVIQTASKLLRFGYGNTNPANGVKNYRELGLEIGDLNSMIRCAMLAPLVFADDIEEGEARKMERLAKYMRSKRNAKDQD